MSLATVQAGSGLIFSSFLGLHFINHFAASISFEQAIKAQQSFRKLYHRPAIEAVLLTSATVHLASGLLRAYLKRKRRAGKEKQLQQQVAIPENGAKKVHRYTGYALAALFPGHIIATRIYPVLKAWWNGAGSLMQARVAGAEAIDYSIVPQSLAKFPGLFHVYYFILGSAGLYHMVYGLTYALGYWRRKLPVSEDTQRSFRHLLIGAGVISIGVMLYRQSYASSSVLSRNIAHFNDFIGDMKSLLKLQ